VSPSRATVVDGTRYRSGAEAAVARDLIDRGVSFTYEAERFLYESPRVYTPDFNLANGIHVEFKGRFTSEDRRKLLDVKRANPTLDLRIVFQRARARLSRAPKSQTYGAWATKHGFPWAEGRVPEEWLQ
jgi:hypothetical protein